MLLAGVSEGVPFVADPVGVPAGAATVGDGLVCRRIAGSPDRRIAGSPDRRIAGSPGRAASLSRDLDSPMRAPRKAPLCL